MSELPSSDPLGHQLLDERLAMIPEFLLDESAFDWSDFSLREDRVDSFLICGLGSSSGHARYLSYLLQHFTAFSSRFLPVSEVAALTEVPEGTVLVVISQGLSPNAWLALEKRDLFQDTVILTSVSEDHMKGYKTPAFCERFSKLRSEGVHVLRYPLEAEYDVLIRIVGPFLGYCACLLLVKRLAPEAEIEFQRRRLRDLAIDSRTKALRLCADAYDELKQGLQIVTSFPLSEIGANLSYKVLEGLYCPAPTLWNYFDVAHGLLQKNAFSACPVWILESADDSADLLDAVVQSFERVGCLPRRIVSSLPRHLSILDFEMQFNHVVIELIKAEGIDQRNWPGKGEDDLLYDLGQATDV